MREYERQGLNKKQYDIIHSWLIRKHGSANQCVSLTCTGKSKNFQWALLKGKLYEKNPENFIQLCASCHMKYDMTPERLSNFREIEWTEEMRLAARNRRIGKLASKETLKKMSEARMGDKNPMYGVSIRGRDSSWFGRHHSDESKEKIRSHHAKATREQICEIRLKHASGVKQVDLSKQYGLSKASINRIVKLRRYVTW